MSTIRVNAIKNTNTTDGGIGIDGSGHVTIEGQSLPSAGPLSSRNKVINGNMRIDQRNSGSSVTITSSDYTLDRWRAGTTDSSKFSVQQSTTAPAGFTNSLLFTSLSADSGSAGDQYGISQRIEGNNIADLAWGTSDAKSVTLSFWVRSSLTGTFGGSLRNNSTNRSYPFTYAISSADTWEYKTLTVPGDTSGTWNTSTSIGILLNFGLGEGSTYSGPAGAWAAANYTGATGAVQVTATNSATWYITGVQLEVGSVATPFEHRSYGDELQRCQRYYWNVFLGDTASNNAIAQGSNYNGITSFFDLYPPVAMRTSPTLEASNSTGYYIAYEGGSGTNVSTVSLDSTTTPNVFEVSAACGGTTGRATIFRRNNSSAILRFKAEL